MDKEEAKKNNAFPFLFLTTLMVLAFILSFPLARGYDFYLRSLDGRIEHPEYRTLSSGGVIGHGYGIAGTGLILTNLLYLARRRLAWLPIGSLSRWLDVHVVTGIAGSVLVLYHSAFQLRTPIATVTSLSLAVVVFTGLVGRYIYALTPKSGDQTLEAKLLEVDVFAPGFGEAVRAALLECPTTRLRANASMVRVLWTVPRWIFEARRRRRAVRRVAKSHPQFTHLDRKQRRWARGLVRDVARLAAGEIDRIAGGTVLRLWRGLHRYMAIVMVISVTLHIGVAWFYGYRWIFSK